MACCPSGRWPWATSWKPADKVVAALLGLDGATRCDVQCVLKEVTKTVARVEFSGSVEGPVNDTTAKIEIKGKYRFDLRTGRIDWFALVTKEDRGISQVAAGFNVTVRFQMTITPEETPPQLAKEKLAGLGVEPTPEMSQLRYESPQDRWQITYDRRWYLNSDDRENALLKLIRQGALTGQCNIASLPQRDPDKLVSLEDYQNDVRRALGKTSASSSRPSSRSIPPGIGCCGWWSMAWFTANRPTCRSAGLLPRGRPAGPAGGVDLHRRAGASRTLRRGRPARSSIRCRASCKAAITVRTAGRTSCGKPAAKARQSVYRPLPSTKEP